MRSLFSALVLGLSLTAGCAAPSPVSPQASAGSPAPAPAGALKLWPAPSGAEADVAIEAANLGAMDMSAGAPHFHFNLLVFKDGQPVVVPSSLGTGSKMMASLHTHSDDGFVHVEGGPITPLKLTQLFTMWRVPFDGAVVYVNGVQAPDTAAVVLGDKQTIAVIFGTAPAHIPSSNPSTSQ